MKKIKRVGIVGAGGIGGRLAERLQERGDEVCFLLRRSSQGALPLFNQLLLKEKPEAVFIAISTLDQGQAACEYIISCAQEGIPVITCEKGSLAYHADALMSYLPLIGFTATVGGGTGMLEYVKKRHPNGQLMSISVVLNGTLNFILDAMQGRGRTLGEACEEASKLGIAEPGNDGPQSLINGELTDVRRKVCVFFNTVLANDEFLTPDKFGEFSLTRDEVQTLSEEGADCRMIASFSNHPSAASASRHSSEFLGTNFKTAIGNWTISAGFRRVVHQSSWLPGGVGNAIHIVEGEFGKGGKYTLVGPGAGAEPTTSAMLNDFDMLCP